MDLVQRRFEMVIITGDFLIAKAIIAYLEHLTLYGRSNNRLINGRSKCRSYLAKEWSTTADHSKWPFLKRTLRSCQSLCLELNNCKYADSKSPNISKVIHLSSIVVDWHETTTHQKETMLIIVLHTHSDSKYLILFGNLKMVKLHTKKFFQL